MIGRRGSKGFPGKNIKSVLGRPLCSYPLRAAKKTSLVDRIYVSTDCDEIKNISVEFGAEIINRPETLCSTEALGEDVFKHGYDEIKKRLEMEGEKIELMVLLFANAATVTSEMISEGITKLREMPHVDSAVSTSVYNMWSPLRARTLNHDGCLTPFVPFEIFGDPKTLNCDRDSQGDVYFADMSVSVVRPYCLEKLSEGMLPQKWMGKKIAAIKSWGGCDVDYEWQMPMVEFWLKKHGIKDLGEK